MTIYTLEELINITNGGSWTENEYALLEKDIHVVKVTNMVNGVIERTTNDHYLPNSLYDYYSAHKLYRNDVCIATVGSHPSQQGSVVGRTIKVSEEFEGSFLNQNAAILRVKDTKKLNSNFFYYLTKTVYFKHFVESRARGSANQVRMAIGELQKFTFDYPTMENQNKIAGILSAYDELIENNKKRIALLETMVEELYKEWFVRFRFPNYENTEFEKGVPKNWQREEINYFCQEVKKSIKKENLNSEQKYIGLEHLSRKDFAIYDYATADTVDSDKLEFQKNDILFGKIRPYLHKVCLANFNGICSTDIIVIRAKKDLFFSYILLTVFSNTFVDLANVSSNGTKMPRANWGYLKKVKIPLPPQDLLKKFNEICLPIFQKIDVLLQENELLISKKNQLLPRLISGKLSVEHLDIQQPPTSAQPTHSE